MYANSIDWHGLIGEDWIHNMYQFVCNDNLNQESMTNKK